MSKKKGQLALFLIFLGVAFLFITLTALNIIHASSVLQVKKTITLSTDMSDQGTSVFSVLNREHADKTYMRILGESTADNYASQNQDGYSSLKQTLNKFQGFNFEFQENPLGLDPKSPSATPKYGECGHTEEGLTIKLTWPSSTKRVTSGFGYRDSPRPCYCHSGVDIASSTGSDSVNAAYDGKVIYTYTKCEESPNCFNFPKDNKCNCNGGFGNRIAIEHTATGGKKFYTHYYHLGKVMVSIGESVKAGQKIAESGNTGRSEATHLHFELATTNNLKDESALNPCPYFENEPIGCQKPNVKSCNVLAKSNTFDVEIPLPGAGSKIKGKVVMKKW